MKTLICICFLSLGALNTFAHDAKVAFFTYSSLGKSLVVDAEFPWSIRNALLTFRPEIETSKDKTDFEKAMFDYVAENLIIKDANYKTIKLLNVFLTENFGHSHQVSFQFIYESNSIFEVTNTLLFNQSNKQINHNTIQLDGAEKSFSTTVNHPDFKVDQASYKFFYWSVLILLLSAILIVLYKK